MKPVATLKRALRPWRLPALEMRNKIVGVGTARRNRKFQAEEIERLRQLHGLHGFSAKVLVVVPTYKRPKELAKAVGSVLSQTYEDLAVVVVDDAGGLTTEFEKDPRLVAVSLSRNCASLGVVRNVGIGLAHSEFVAFLDDDNMWTPDHVSTGVAALEADPSLAAIYTSVRRLRPDGSELDILAVPFDRRKLGVSNYVDANSIVARRTPGLAFSLLRRGRNTRPQDDWEFVWRISRKERIVLVPTVTVAYSVHPGSYFSPWDDADVYPT